MATSSSRGDPTIYPPRSPRGGGILSVPPVVSWLLVVMISVFAMQVFLPPGPQRALEAALGFIPLRFTQAIEGERALWPLIRPAVGHMFVHGGVTHLGFNSLWLLVFGAGVARRLGADWRGGPVPAVLFVIFFLLCGFGGVGLYYVLQPRADILLIGASGAISGLLAASLRFVLRDPAGGYNAPLAALASAPVLVTTVAFVGLNLATAVGLGGPAGFAIAWEAHIGGFLTGLLLFPVFDRLARA